MLDKINLLSEHLLIAISVVTILAVHLIGFLSMLSQKKANEKNQKQTENAAWFSGPIWDFITAMAMIWPVVAFGAMLVYPGTAKNLVEKLNNDLDAILQSVEKTEEKREERWKIEVAQSLMGEITATTTCGKSLYKWSSTAYSTGYEVDVVQTLFDKDGNILPITDEAGEVYKSIAQKLTAAPKISNFSTNELPYKICNTLKLDGKNILTRNFTTWTSTPSIDSCNSGEAITIYPNHIGMSILNEDEPC